MLFLAFFKNRKFSRKKSNKITLNNALLCQILTKDKRMMVNSAMVILHGRILVIYKRKRNRCGAGSLVEVPGRSFWWKFLVEVLPPNIDI